METEIEYAEAVEDTDYHNPDTHYHIMSYSDASFYEEDKNLPEWQKRYFFFQDEVFKGKNALEKARKKIDKFRFHQMLIHCTKEGCKS